MKKAPVNKEISELLLPYTRNFIAKEVFGGTKEDINKNRILLCRRFKEHNWTKEEIAKITIFLDMQIRSTLIKLVDSIKEYEHESEHSIYADERESSEFVDIFLTKIHKRWN